MGKHIIEQINEGTEEVIDSISYAVGDPISYIIKTIMMIILREGKIKIIILKEKNNNMQYRNDFEDLQIR